MGLFDWLFGSPSSTTTHDPLPDLIESAHEAEHDAWDAVNESRRRRGERPIALAWEDLTGPPARECGEERAP